VQLNSNRRGACFRRTLYSETDAAPCLKALNYSTAGSPLCIAFSKYQEGLSTLLFTYEPARRSLRNHGLRRLKRVYRKHGSDRPAAAALRGVVFVCNSKRCIASRSIFLAYRLCPYLQCCSAVKNPNAHITGLRGAA